MIKSINQYHLQKEYLLIPQIVFHYNKEQLKQNIIYLDQYLDKKFGNMINLNLNLKKKSKLLKKMLEKEKLNKC